VDLVRLAEGYVMDLLFRTPAKAAVSQLRGEWSRRAQLAGRSGLSEAEDLVDRVALYASRVHTGGHGCFFAGVARTQAEETVAALRTVGLEQLTDLLERALALCDPYPLPEDRVGMGPRRTRYVSDDPRFASLDRAMWRVDVDAMLLDFLRRHSDSILRPERGLPVGRVEGEAW
jgi:hypothetical protein